MKQYSNIIVTGSMAWDTIMDFPHPFIDYFQQDKLHQINVSFVVDNLEKQMGGTATNIAYGISVTLNTVGKSKPDIYILGGLGKDGGDHLKFFKKNNIKTDGIVREKKLYSAYGSVITDIKDNQIWGYYNGACIMGKNADFARYTGSDSLIVISANHPDAFLAAQRHAILHGIDYLYDVGMALTWIKQKDLENGVTQARWLVGNDYEIAAIAKRLKISVAGLVKKGIAVITTLGNEGVRYDYAIDSAAVLLPVSAHSVARCRRPLRPRHLSHKTIKVKAYDVKKVVHPTGAGDAWRGGFIAGIVSGMDLEYSLKLGNTVASFAVETYGTVNYRFTGEQLFKRFDKVG
ncbi:MAG: PfkB family carbohydrate kinase [Patescibacteria group bacterium]